jgi:hypothetical protein
VTDSAPLRRLSLKRSGGLFAGNALETAVAEQDLSPDEQQELHQALEGLDLANLAARSPLGGPGADAYQYELTVESGEESQRLIVSGREPPDELRPLISMLERRAERKRRAR